MADVPKKIGGVKPKAARPTKPRVSSTPHPESLGHAVRLIDDRIKAHEKELRELVAEIRAETTPNKVPDTDGGKHTGYGLSIDSTPIGWYCPYNCTPTPTQLGLIHRYNCAYWENEGREKHPL